MDNSLNAISPIWTRDLRNNFISICTHCPASSSVTIDNNLRRESGWNFCTDGGDIYPYYGYALYKMSNNQTNDYFYIDFRDSYYGSELQSQVGYQHTDIIIYLNKNYDGNGHSCYEYDKRNEQYYRISNGEVIRIWELENTGPSQPYIPETGCFPDFWQNNLFVTQTASNNPRLVWGPHPTFATTNYKLYRAVSATPVAHPATLSYSLINTTTAANIF